MHPVYNKALPQPQRRLQWQQIITDWRSSGLKRKAFCEQQQVKLTDLKRWDYRLRQASHPSSAVAVQLKAAAKKTKSSLTFMPVELAPPAEASQVDSLTIQHQNGFSLTMNLHTDEHLIKKALYFVREASC